MIRILFLLLSGMLCASTLSAQSPVRVTNGRIALGTTMRTNYDAWMYFHCAVENTDTVSHKVTVRVSHDSVPGDTAGTYSTDFIAPPASKVNVKIPFMTSPVKEYDLKVFVDGRHLATGQANPALVSQLPARRRFAAFMNDSDDSPGSFVQLPVFKDKLFTNNFSSRRLAMNGADYNQFDCMIFYKPDFTKYPPDAFNAILEYVANGGVCVFMTPESVLAASKTPLEAMLPVNAVKITKVNAVKSFSLLAKKFKDYGGDGCKFLVSAPKQRSAVILEHENMPVLAVGNYGLGTVRIATLEISESSFAASRDAYQKVLQYLFSTQRLATDGTAFSPVLDEMTGFSIPSRQSVLTVSALYFCLVLVTGAICFALKKPLSAWIFTSIAACLAFVAILFYASVSFSGKSTVLARIRTHNAFPAGTLADYCAYFAESAETLDTQLYGGKVRFARIGVSHALRDMFGGIVKAEQPKNEFNPENTASYGAFPAGDTEASLNAIEFKVAENGRMGISGLAVRPRSSEQFLFTAQNFVSAGSADSTAASPPVLETDHEGNLTLHPYNPPDDMFGETTPDAAFLIMPSGIRELEKTADGAYILAQGRGVVSSPRAQRRAEALRLARRSGVPYLAFQTPARETELESENHFNVQGFDFTLIPCKLAFPAKNFTLPPEFSTPFAPDAVTTPLLRGNTIVKNLTLEADGMKHSFAFSLPAYLNGVFTPVTLKLELEGALPRSANVSVALRVPSAGGGFVSIPPASQKGGIFEFTSIPVSPDGVYSFELRTDASAQDENADFDDTAFLRRPKWILRGLRLSADGTLSVDKIPLEL